MDHFRNLDPTIQAATVAVFAEVAVAGDKGIRIREIERRLGLSKSGASRHVSQLSAKNWRDGGGADTAAAPPGPKPTS